MTGERWLLVFNGLWIAVDITAAPDQKLTDGMWRFRRRHPLLATAAVMVTGCHLLGVFDALGVAYLDPYTTAHKLLHRMTRRPRRRGRPC